MSELTEMEAYLQKLFTEAGQDLKKKFLKYTQDFQRLDAAKQQAVEDGNITEDEYKEWRKNKLLYGMHWQRLIDRNTSELLKYNQTAVKYINGEVPQIFASGYNKVAEQIPDSPVAGFDFELINADTVNNLVHEDGIILPPKKKVDPEKDKAWNAKLINAQLLQGIMQGESIPEMAKRMQTVANSDLAGATRTARTMHTAAQNAGRQSGYNRAAKQGIIFEKTWLAANNERTRLSHSLMNGQTVAHDEKFVSPVTGVKLMFPGDWNAEGGDVGSEIYNCRCTLITKFKGFKKLNGEEPEPHTKHEAPKEEAKQDNQVVAIENARTVSQVTELLANTGWFSERGIERYLSLEGCDLESAKAVFRGYQKVFDKIPNFQELFGQLYGVKASQQKGNAYANGGLADVNVNTFWFSDYAKLSEQYAHDVEMGWHIPNSTAEDIIVHELGHNVDRLIARALGKGDNAFISKTLKTKVMNSFEKKPNIEYAVSGYAAKNNAEWFAECFVEYVISDNPRKVAAKFGEELEKLFEKVEKANKK